MSFPGMKKRLADLARIPALAARDHRHYLDENGKDKRLASLSRSERRKLAKEGRQLSSEYFRIMERIYASGAGFPVDRVLHQLAAEYTNRYASSGIYNQPLSFNYFEPFCTVQLIKGTIAPFAEPVEEIDHLFSVLDFFDYTTGKESEGFELSQLTEIPDGKALHFTANGDVNELTFLTSEGREFVVSGFSLVRRDNFLHWYIIGGATFTDDEWAALSMEEMDVSGIPPWKRLFLDQVRARTGNKVGLPTPLEGTKSTQRTIIAGEIDLTTAKHLSRCFMTEWDNAFMLVPDDPDVFDHMADKEQRASALEDLKQRIADASVLWSLGEAMLQLPSYFAFKLNVAKSLMISAGQSIRPPRKGGKGLNVRFKTVTSIEMLDDGAVAVRAFTPAHYKMETEGFWRRLAPDAEGQGPNGELVKGRTWAKRTSEWRTEDAISRTIYVKSTIAAAKTQVDEYVRLAEEAERKLDRRGAHDRGVLYVLRCALMSAEVYKVGWTSGTAEERSKELSAATGVPSSFLVVDYWQHADAAGLEKNVHALLDPYRLNDRREFFRADYQMIKRTIEQEIVRNSRR